MLVERFNISKYEWSIQPERISIIKNILFNNTKLNRSDALLIFPENLSQAQVLQVGKVFKKSNFTLLKKAFFAKNFTSYTGFYAIGRLNRKKSIAVINTLAFNQETETNSQDEEELT